MAVDPHDNRSRRKLDPGFFQRIKNMFPAIVTILVLLGVYFIGVRIADGAVVVQAANPATARGLITFIITCATILIAIVLVLAAIMSPKDNHEKRFQMGKEVLTMLIGVLGTIVGFYYGATKDDTSFPVIGIHLTEASTGKQLVARGSKFTIVALATDGKAPYKFNIKFQPPIVNEVSNVDSTDGILRQEVSVPDGATLGQEVHWIISVKDSVGNELTAGASKGAIIVQ